MECEVARSNPPNPNPNPNPDPHLKPGPNPSSNPKPSPNRGLHDQLHFLQACKRTHELVQATLLRTGGLDPNPNPNPNPNPDTNPDPNTNLNPNRNCYLRLESLALT